MPWSRIPKPATSPSPDRAKSACTSTKSPPRKLPARSGSSARFLEMGGKDAIIVDADADIDSAVEGVAQAAFGFQGQKCSACSRAIVDERVYDKFLEQLKARVEKIQIGDVTENAAMGAVINEGSMKTDPRIHRARQERRTPPHRRRTRARRRLFHPAHGDSPTSPRNRN